MELWNVSWSFVAGVILGLIYFGGLWLTVNKLPSKKHPAGWFLMSLLVRLSIVLTGFYLVSQGQVENLLVCLVGLIVGRLIIMRRMGKEERSVSSSKLVAHD